ncbi:hypothetical protein GT037_010758 [Alternaria burnsii]|uniref:Xylanolytic transcriptional activator regulatory domain-containing protein n=1 Tax=Alternaria burnsii TaxID=1187904 RepID=A0A8H7AVB6_9PLEO|nr:uncharacterized protein GT037_010758 [Alternaria burnsii]KAF7671197.1 hypothetical protein GT037_010758 [Alternaria burnsii]
MVKLLQQIEDSVPDEQKQQIADTLSRVTADVSDAMALSEHESPPTTEDTGTESDVSAGVGSNYEADILDEDLHKERDSQSTGFIGKSSEVQWLRHLQHDTERDKESLSASESLYVFPSVTPEFSKRRTEILRQHQQQKSKIPTSISTFYLDNEGIEIDYAVEPYKLPTIEVAQRLIQRYMHTVHDTFPVLSQETFINQVRGYYASVTQGTPCDMSETWLAMLNLVFAIGARFSHLTEADWQADSRDHIVYQSRAQILDLGEPSLAHQPDLARIQVTALFAFYFSTVGNVNRSWVAIGIALRYALALGLHLRNEDETLSTAEKEILVHVWWALQIFEGSLSIMLGRPSLVHEDQYSTPLPLPVSMEQLSDDFATPYWDNQYKGAGIHGDAGRSAPTASEPSSASSLLRHMAEINVIGQNAMAGLYSANISTKSWKDIQRTMVDLCGELERWKQMLPQGLDSISWNDVSRFGRNRLMLQMSYIRVQILTTRPCLCRVNSRIPNQTESSASCNGDMARACVNAAKKLTDILPDHATAAQMFETGPWWSLVHHIMQALTVLLVELSYCMDHVSGDQGLLPRVKKLTRRLRMLGETDRVAERAYRTSFNILKTLALRLRFDISNLLQEDVSFLVTPLSQSHAVASDPSQINYNYGVSSQSMFTFPPPLFQGNSQTPVSAGRTGTSPQGSSEFGSSFGNLFRTAHDQHNHFLFEGQSS